MAYQDEMAAITKFVSMLPTDVQESLIDLCCEEVDPIYDENGKIDTLSTFMANYFAASACGAYKEVEEFFTNCCINIDDEDLRFTLTDMFGLDAADIESACFDDWD